MMATVARGEGVHLLPAERWADYELPPQLLTRSPGHMTDWVRACKGGDAACSDFRISGPYTEWVVLGMIAFRVPGKLEWDSENMPVYQQRRGKQVCEAVVPRGVGAGALVSLAGRWLRLVSRLAGNPAPSSGRKAACREAEVSSGARN